jgi:hypothetical protein
MTRSDVVPEHVAPWPRKAALSALLTRLLTRRLSPIGTAATPSTDCTDFAPAQTAYGAGGASRPHRIRVVGTPEGTMMTEKDTKHDAGALAHDLIRVVGRQLSRSDFACRYQLSAEHARELEIATVNAVTHRRMSDGAGARISRVPNAGVSLFATAELGWRGALTFHVTVTNELPTELSTYSLSCVSLTDASTAELAFDHPLRTEATSDVLAPGDSVTFTADYTLGSSKPREEWPIIGSFLIEAETADGELVLAQEDAWADPDLTHLNP